MNFQFWKLSPEIQASVASINVYAYVYAYEYTYVYVYVGPVDLKRDIQALSVPGSEATSAVAWRRVVDSFAKVRSNVGTR